MDKNNIKNVFKEYLLPIDEKVVSKMASQLNLDKYVKKLDTLTFVKLFIFASLHQISSLTDISFKLNHDEALQQEIGMKSISTSQLSRKLRNIPPELFRVVMHHLVQKIHQTFGLNEGNRLLGQIHLIDSSTITLCLNQYPWAPKNKFTSGIKMHTRVVYHQDLTYPEEVILTPARPADITQLNQLMIHEKGVIHIFDRGYFDFKRFDDYCEKGIRFVTRIKENTKIIWVEEIPSKHGSSIIREAIVKIGKMNNPLRFLETVDSEGNKIQIIMNDAKMSAEEISELYRKRWQIELFFKWMKQHMPLKKMYGKSQNAVYNQIYIALITFCLIILMKKKVYYKEAPLKLLKYLRSYWSSPFFAFTDIIGKKPNKTSKGRRRLNYEQTYNEILNLIENGEIVM